MKILITGGAGFIGINLAFYYLQKEDPISVEEGIKKLYSWVLFNKRIFNNS